MMEKKLRLVLVVIVLLASVLFLLAVFDVFNWQPFKFLLFGKDQSLATLSNASLIFLNCLLVIATVLIVYVAWEQLSGIKRVGEADFLFRIEERFGSEPIIKARAIIQKLYRESNKVTPGAKERIHRRYIARRIDEISKDADSYEDYT